MAADRCRKLVRVDGLIADERRLQHLQIAPRQQYAGVGDGRGVAGELHAVFRGAKRGGADAFAGRQQRPGQGAGVESPPERVPEPASHVAEVAILAAVDVFADAARQHDAVDRVRARRSARSDRAASSGGGSGRMSDRRDQRVGHRIERPCRGRPDRVRVALAPIKAGLALRGAGRPDRGGRCGRCSSTTCSRPPTCIAAVAMTSAVLHQASLVVPPPMSMLRMRLPWSVTPARRRSRRLPASLPCDGRRWRRRNRRLVPPASPRSPRRSRAAAPRR